MLRKSTTLDEESKKKIEPVLTANCMSSEESIVADSEDGDPGRHSSDSETPEVSKKKRLIRHQLPWRSEDFEDMLKSLDRKLDRRRDARSKGMCLEVEIGGISEREKPTNLPEWANNLHHQLFS